MSSVTKYDQLQDHTPSDVMCCDTGRAEPLHAVIVYKSDITQ